MTNDKSFPLLDSTSTQSPSVESTLPYQNDQLAKAREWEKYG